MVGPLLSTELTVKIGGILSTVPLVLPQTENSDVLLFIVAVGVEIVFVTTCLIGVAIV